MENKINQYHWNVTYLSVFQIEIGTILLFTNNVTQIPPEYLANATISNTIAKQLEFQTAFEDWLTVAPTVLTELFVSMDFNVTGTNEEWVAMLGRLQEASPFPSTLPWAFFFKYPCHSGIQSRTCICNEHDASNTLEFNVLLSFKKIFCFGISLFLFLSVFYKSICQSWN